MKLWLLNLLMRCVCQRGIRLSSRLINYNQPITAPKKTWGGQWFFTDYANQARKKIYFVKYENQADLKIYFVDYENQVGWNKKGKKHLMY